MSILQRIYKGYNFILTTTGKKDEYSVLQLLNAHIQNLTVICDFKN